MTFAKNNNISQNTIDVILQLGEKRLNFKSFFVLLLNMMTFVVVGQHLGVLLFVLAEHLACERSDH